MRRILPAVGLFFLAPLIAEFLLGNLPITMLGTLIVLAPMYGGGALLIRETVRRTGRGWPTIVLLALVYAILEEAFFDQTLFNPNYLGLNMHLLDQAYISALGIGVWWTVFVLTLHTVWSIPVSIALIEALVPARATTPWLGRFGLAVVAILFLFGGMAVTSFSIRQDRIHFVASVPQFASAGVVCIILMLIAFHLPRFEGRTQGRSAPSPWLVGASSLLAGSLFLITPRAWGWWAVAAYLVLDLVIILAVATWSRSSGWDGRHRLALAGGAALAYAWHAFVQTPVVGSAANLNRIGNLLFAAAAVVLIAIAARTTSASAHRLRG